MVKIFKSYVSKSSARSNPLSSQDNPYIVISIDNKSGLITVYDNIKYPNAYFNNIKKKNPMADLTLSYFKKSDIK